MIQRIHDSGEVAKSYRYDAFGNEETPEPLDANPFRYCCEYFDAETATLYLRARSYDAKTGRFTQEDSAKDGGNWYAYCGGNPILLVDPSGNSGIKPDGSIYLSKNKDDEEMVCDKLILRHMQELYAEGTTQERKDELVHLIKEIQNSGNQFESWSVDYTYGIDYYTIPDTTEKLTKIMEDSVNLQPSRPETGYWKFAALVGAGGIYDLKAQEEWQQNRHYIFNGEVVEWDAPGNLLYGYLGIGLGFTTAELLSGAGIAQVLDKSSSIAFLFSNWDDPSDQANIKKGIQYYKQRQIERKK